MAFHVVIPARYASTRLPGKPLLEIGGEPMIRRVAARACASAAEEVVVATDDARIVEALREGAGRASAMLTDPALPSGTDRVAAVATARGWSDETIVVNVQGDEPFLPPRLIEQAARLLAGEPRAAIATLATPITSLEEFLDPNAVKVVTTLDGTALYFSRAPIPWTREGARIDAAGHAVPGEFGGALRHVGLYAYRVGALKRITALAPSSLETREKLEQLRALQHGLRIVVGVCLEPPGLGVDTESDLERARALAEAG
ncbi:MAG TPA: 3-deoxy-manno-octulosonate cytidylyltransferase [Steroidobacteraceae bacterium]|nr:3-deoxy-manno-octulosonate cytidylyltransferase [Steroidobacteraceae bacterium]